MGHEIKMSNMDEIQLDKNTVKKAMKILSLNVGLGVVDTIIFSPGLLAIGIVGTGVFEMAFGTTAALMSAVVFIVGNYKLLTEKEKIIRTNEIKTIEECIEALNQNSDKKTFQKVISTIIEQIDMFQKKKETIKQVLLQKFDATEISYTKFNDVILNVENVFNANIKSIINKINAFDEKDYNRMRKDEENKFSKEFINAKMQIYGDYISFVKNATEDNEQVILKLDKFLFEVSKFDSLEHGEIENMNAMKEMEELINKIQLYN